MFTDCADFCLFPPIFCLFSAYFPPEMVPHPFINSSMLPICRFSAYMFMDSAYFLLIFRSFSAYFPPKILPIFRWSVLPGCFTFPEISLWLARSTKSAWGEEALCEVQDSSAAASQENMDQTEVYLGRMKTGQDITNTYFLIFRTDLLPPP